MPVHITKLKRAKSTNSLIDLQDDSAVFTYGYGGFNKASLRKDSANVSQSQEVIAVLKHKISKLNDMVHKQQNTLKMLKENFNKFYTVKRNIEELCMETTDTADEIRFLSNFINDLEPVKSYSPAKSLLAAIELKNTHNFDIQMRHTLNNFYKFLQSEKFKDRITSTAAESIRRVVDDCISDTFPSSLFSELNTGGLYRNSEKTPDKPCKEFEKMEKNSTPLMKLIKEKEHRSRDKESAQLQNDSCDKQAHVESTDTCFLKKQIKSTESTKFTEFSPRTELTFIEKYEYFPDTLYSPTSPPQPVDPDLSIIDHLMKSALINKQINEGHINESFEDALSSSNLSLVMAACRAADPVAVFNPCSLTQSVLLSLVQQLATDMVHETQLKCRYLEEALINLDVSEQTTRAYLPLVLGEVRKHLIRFVRTYPNHVANRRITLIVMAADNLLK